MEPLWDSGSQVCIIDEQWKAQYLPKVKLQNLDETIDAQTPLKLVSANGMTMTYGGWVELTFRLASCLQTGTHYLCTLLELTIVN